METMQYQLYFICRMYPQRRWCSGIMQDSHSCDPGSIPGRRSTFKEYFPVTVVCKKPIDIYPPEGALSCSLGACVYCIFLLDRVFVPYKNKHNPIPQTTWRGDPSNPTSQHGMDRLPSENRIRPPSLCSCGRRDRTIVAI